tara:strand:+ start:14135 stop:14866 length:732 start_codon:yes stop_codon:yes gene_type:complete
MKISQSALKSFYDENFCELKWEKFFIEGYRSRPTNAMIDGLVFEELTIGSTRDNESFIGMIPRLKNGNVSKREADLVYLSEFAKKTMKDLEIKILEVQPEWETDTLIGHPDALITYKGNLAIMDLKYTAIREDESCKWNPYAWSDLKYKDFRQALHYVEMYYQLYDVYLPFFYLVFGKSGWVKFISVDITSNAMEDYRMLLNTFSKDLQDFEPKPIKNYSICRKCELNCTKRTEKPNVINIEI